MKLTFDNSQTGLVAPQTIRVGYYLPRLTDDDLDELMTLMLKLGEQHQAATGRDAPLVAWLAPIIGHEVRRRRDDGDEPCDVSFPEISFKELGGDAVGPFVLATLAQQTHWLACMVKREQPKKFLTLALTAFLNASVAVYAGAIA